LEAVCFAEIVAPRFGGVVAGQFFDAQAAVLGVLVVLVERGDKSRPASNRMV
jgi:hypothetical protein